MAKKKVLLIFPTAWDRRQLESSRPRWSDGFDVILGEPTDDCAWNFDVLAYIDRRIEDPGPLDGVLSSSDYPGATAAAAIATGRGLPGPRPEAVIGASHKYYSRLAQRAAVPEATADFHLVDSEDPETFAHVRFPCFVKPVKGAFSVLARRIDSREELAWFLSRPSVREFTRSTMHIFNRLLRRFTSFEVDGRHFLAEELLRGEQATVEGFVSGGEEVGILGIVDSEMYPGTSSFSRFVYPSCLPAEVQERMGEIARRAALELGLANTFFNIEMIYERNTGRVIILEVNPRLCGQFGDLYEKVDGMNSYVVALRLAAGEPIFLERGRGAFRVAASCPLRVFEPTRVERAPREPELAQIEVQIPGTLVWPECRPGQELRDFDAEDGSSCRYAVVNLGADRRDELDGRLEDVVRLLGYGFAPI